MCIVPALLYGIEVWYQSSKFARTDVERVHRMMVWLLCNNFVSSYAELLTKLDWRPVWKTVLVLKMRLFYKLYNTDLFEPLLPRVTARRSARVNHTHSVDLLAKKTCTRNTFLY